MYLRFTTKGAFGDKGSIDVDEDDDDEWTFLKSLQKLCFSLKRKHLPLVTRNEKSPTIFIFNYAIPQRLHNIYLLTLLLYILSVI